MSSEPGVVIVGAGHAGGRAAERLRFHGYDKAITLIGSEAYLPYERPPLSKGILTAEDLADPPFLLNHEYWASSEVEFLPGTRCLAIDRKARSVALSSGRSLPYAHLILATGLTPRRLPSLDAVQERVLALQSYDEARALRRRLCPGAKVLLVGAGFIGLEVAASARQCGVEVTVIEAAERPLARALPGAFSAYMARLHRDRGVEILCGRQIQSAAAHGDGVRITLDGGETVDADLVVCGIGGQPNDQLARDAGLPCDNGVRIDRRCRTSDPSIYAVGDIACLTDGNSAQPRRLESWKNAEDTAAVAAAAICGLQGDYASVPWFWTDQYGFNFQFTGDLSGKGNGHKEPSLLERGEIGDSDYLAYLLDGDHLLGAFGIDCGRDIRRARSILEKGGQVTSQQLKKVGLTRLDDRPAALRKG